MTEPATKGDVERLSASVESIARTIQDQTEAIRSLVDSMNYHAPTPLQHDTVGGKAEIHFNGHGIALWVSTICCVAMLTAVVFLGGVVNWTLNRTVDQGHQMNALYMSVPGLRELVDKQIKQVEQTKQSPKEESKP